MNIFRKRKDAPDSQKQAPSMAETHASSPASDAAVVIGGLDWYRTQFRRIMKLALGLSAALCVSIAVTTLLLLNQPKPQYFRLRRTCGLRLWCRSTSRCLRRRVC